MVQARFRYEELLISEPITDVGHANSWEGLTAAEMNALGINNISETFSPPVGTFTLDQDDHPGFSAYQRLCTKFDIMTSYSEIDYTGVATEAQRLYAGKAKTEVEMTFIFHDTHTKPLINTGQGVRIMHAERNLKSWTAVGNFSEWDMKQSPDGTIMINAKFVSTGVYTPEWT